MTNRTNTLELPFLGSGGCGGSTAARTQSHGGDGGNGGGAILISAQTIDYSGSLLASGGNGGYGWYGNPKYPYPGTDAGGGSGGSIRIEGDQISLNSMNISGGIGGQGGYWTGGNGGMGRIAVYYYTSFSGNFTPGYIEHLGVTNTPTPTASPTATISPTPTTLPAGWYTNSYTYSSTIPHAVTSVNRVNFTDTYTYDENGNMTCRTESGSTYLQTYNVENRIASIAKLASGTCTTPGNYATKWDFTYDGDGIRTATLTTPYVNGQPQTATITRYFFGGSYETSAGAVKKYYSFAGQSIAMKDSAGVQYFLTDHLGSIVATLSSTGTLISQQRYLPFGAPRSIPNSPIVGTDFGYTGQRMLDSGMGGIMDYRARMYSPYINRFLQPDTIIPDLSNPQSWNRFSYVYSNPILHNDPTGHCVGICTIVALIGIAIVLNEIPSDVPQVNPANQGDPNRLFLGLTLTLGAPEISSMAGEGLMGIGNLLNSPRIFGTGVAAYNAATTTTATLIANNRRPSLTEEEFWQKRYQYTNEVVSIPRRAGAKINNEGLSTYDAANWAVEERLMIGKKYKDMMPIELQEETFVRNMKIYGNQFGPPNADWYRINKGYTDSRIIQSAGKPGGADIIPRLLDILDDLWK